MAWKQLSKGQNSIQPQNLSTSDAKSFQLNYAIERENNEKYTATCHPERSEGSHKFAFAWRSQK
jgi:hypothetical protein